MKAFFLQTESSEAECLAVRNGDLAMERVAIVHAEILMLLLGFSEKVCSDLATIEVDHYVQKHYLFSWSGTSKFDGGVMTIKALSEVA